MSNPEDNSATGNSKQEMEAVYRLYLGLARFMLGDGLGGKLLYAGDADTVGRRLARAANIAGAATLVASADAALLRRAMREGAVDFVVNALDEGLRILKNEIRKQQPVAVGVSVAPEILLREMAERGVQPDLIRAGLDDSTEIQELVERGALRVDPHSLPGGSELNVLPIPDDWKQSTAAFDALLLECVLPEDAVSRRWVRLAPRYLPSEVRRLRSVACDAEAIVQLNARIGITDR